MKEGATIYTAALTALPVSRIISHCEPHALMPPRTMCRRPHYSPNCWRLHNHLQASTSDPVLCFSEILRPKASATLNRSCLPLLAYKQFHEASCGLMTFARFGFGKVTAFELATCALNSLQTYISKHIGGKTLTLPLQESAPCQ